MVKSGKKLFVSEEIFSMNIHDYDDACKKMQFIIHEFFFLGYRKLTLSSPVEEEDLLSDDRKKREEDRGMADFYNSNHNGTTKSMVFQVANRKEYHRPKRTELIEEVQLTTPEGKSCTDSGFSS